MASLSELAVRALRKARVVGVYEVADADQLAIAEEGIRAAHALLDAQGLLRWTLADIPQPCELGYVWMAAYLIADDFVQQKDPGWMAQGASSVQAFVYLPVNEPTYSEYF